MTHTDSAMAHGMSEPSAAQVRERAIRGGIARLLARCTDTERACLHHIHDHAPWKGLTNCPASQLDETYELLRRTVEAQQVRKGQP